MISTTLLSNSESVGLEIIEIVFVPSIKILSDKYPDSQAMAIQPLVIQMYLISKSLK
jgi:hypothetical protein